MVNLYPIKLDKHAFRRFGEFEDLLVAHEGYNEEPAEVGFFPDLLRLCNDGKDVSVSITRVAGNDRVIRSCELHNHCCEGILPLDGDIYIYVAPPFWYTQLDKTQAFLVPKGTFVKLKPGVIHGSPQSVSGEGVNVLILLPERTYSNDCEFTDLEEKDYMQIMEDGV